MAENIFFSSEIKKNSDDIFSDFMNISTNNDLFLSQFNNNENFFVKPEFNFLDKKIKKEKNKKIFNTENNNLIDKNIINKRLKNKIAAKKFNNGNSLLSNNIDAGFRVLKLDSSNMNDVFYNAKSTSQSLFDNTVDNVKSDRTPLDLLFQVMLELGIELSAKIEEKEVLGKKYFIVNENDIVACFDNNVSNDVIKELAKIKPIYAVFRDSVFENDAANINCEQLFKSISPSTTIKVL